MVGDTRLLEKLQHVGTAVSLRLVSFVVVTELLNLLLHWYYVCSVLVALYILFEVSAGLILSNSAHTGDKSHSVWTSLFPGQSKLPAALTKIPVFSLATCEFSVLLVTLEHTVLHSTALLLEKGRLQRLRLE